MTHLSRYILVSAIGKKGEYYGNEGKCVLAAHLPVSHTNALGGILFREGVGAEGRHGETESHYDQGE